MLATTAARVTYSSVSPLDRACIALRKQLELLNYAPHPMRAILEHAFREKCLAGLVEAGVLDAEDLEAATEAFVEGYGEVPADSPRWNLPAGVWVTADDIKPASRTAARDRVHRAPRPVSRPIRQSGNAKDLSTIVDKIPSPDDSRAFAQMDGRHDVRFRADVLDLANYRFWQMWAAEAYTEPYRIEAECDELRTARR